MGIERYRAIVRLEEIRSCMEQGEYEAAKEIADSIRKERLKDSSDLFLLASVYRKCGEFEAAKEFLLRIYEKKSSWRVLEELMEVCLAEKNPEEAESYLKEYAKISGGDPRNYIYEYRIGRQKHRPDGELLPILQTLKAEEYTEKYAYELAKLYHKLGREQECMAECADLILWFGEGTYVERAKALQAYYRGELSVEDIKEEAERRIREAEERRAREEEERRAYEEEQRRLEEEARMRAEEEARLAEEERMRLEEEAYLAEERRLWAEEEARRAEEESRRLEEERLAEEENRRLEEEERLALEAIYRAVAEERFGGEVTGVSTEEEEELPEESYYVAEALEEVAAADMSEPMWEDDATAVGTEEEIAEEAMDTEEYEQISLFAEVKQEVQETELMESEELPEYEEVQTQEEAEEPVEEPEQEEREVFADVQVVTKVSKELAARLEEKGILFEEALHEFARIERVRKQLVRMLEVVVTVRRKCHCLIITGESKSGKTTLGTYLAKLLYELSYVKSPRVAKIGAERLNQIDLYEKKEQLRDVCLIVEHAGAMTEETAAKLLEFIQNTNVVGTVILEDNANAISRLLRNHAECNRVFNNRVHLPKYDSSELLGFALEYIREQDYEIGRDAKKRLEQKIEYLTRRDQKNGRLVATMELVKTALEHADDRNQETILNMASAGNFLAAGALELTAEDFGTIR